jgi:hypothetical protein
MSGEKVNKTGIDSLTLFRAKQTWDFGIESFNGRRDEIGNLIGFHNQEYYLTAPVIPAGSAFEDIGSFYYGTFMSSVQHLINPSLGGMNRVDLESAWDPFLCAVKMRELFDKLKQEGQILPTEHLIALMPDQLRFEAGELRDIKIPIKGRSSVALHAWTVPSLAELQQSQDGNYKIPVTGRAIGWTQNEKQRPKVIQTILSIEPKNLEEYSLT